ncbi:MAG TPA: AbrB/MazE/SpoVT family DNA-binding domain-containing protein [Burkholderiales bacterium]|jgi:AbrB family looped-hinge helix DNA binding protein|nr:AbrB/MazE/SpoVT family DNA-binding domain-containing protein [Burkholderiales bacterium]
MIKTLTKVGNSYGLIFDAAVRELSGLKPGDQVNVTVHDGGTIILTPVRKSPDPAQVKSVVRRTLKDYKKTLRKLA